MASTSNSSDEKQVQQLLDILVRDLKDKNLSPQDRFVNLEKLKVCSRNAAICAPLYTVHGMQTLCAHAFDTIADQNSSREALRCIVNSMTISPSSRQTFVELEYAEKASEKYKSDAREDEFLLGRVLFLVTYVRNFNVEKLLDKHHLAENINSAMHRHAQQYGSGKFRPTPLDDMALSETLKLIYNVTNFAPKRVKLLSKNIPHLFRILSLRETLQPPLQPPLTFLINAFMNLEFSQHDTDIFPPSTPSVHVDKLIKILDISLQTKDLELENGHNFEDKGPSLLILLTKLYSVAPDTVKGKMRTSLLPTTEERDKPLGRGNTLSARLLNLLTSALAPNSRTCAAELFWVLSGSDAYTFIRDVGYGFAAGYLLNKGIEIPQRAIDENSELQGIPINPITGQTLEAEERDAPSLAQMTDEEKMREAERLFVLFERIKKSGIVDIRNPVETAIQEGRFQELPDEKADSDDDDN